MASPLHLGANDDFSGFVPTQVLINAYVEYTLAFCENTFTVIMVGGQFPLEVEWGGVGWLVGEFLLLS